MENEPARAAIRVTIDEIGPDQDNIQLARLVADSGEQLTVPLHLLPEGARTGDVFTVSFEPDQDERARRRQRILDLQRRLFGSR